MNPTAVLSQIDCFRVKYYLGDYSTATYESYDYTKFTQPDEFGNKWVTETINTVYK